ncbi:hypothetical protein J7643_04000 [bacterium]|nr:hypothetical protein [bacterium]
MGPFDVTPGRAPQTQDEWDYVLSRLSWGQKMTLINQIKGQVGMQPSVFPPYSGPPTSAPQDPWAGRGGIRSTPDTTFLPPQPQPVPVTGE